jgi:site-specific DNA-methyltransferase (adenine-specific)
MPLKTAIRKETIPLFDGEAANFPFEISEIYNLLIDRMKVGISVPTYSRKNGLLFTGNSLHWLRFIETSSIDLIFADPPYNIQKAEWDKFDTQEQYISWSMEWMREAARILKPNGTLYVCGFSEILADLKHLAMRFFVECKWLVWYYRNKANLGKDWGRSHESILHL